VISRLLIANRGEIALRIIRACRELAIETVAVYSEADARAPHVFAADRAVLLGAAASSESYLSIGRLIDAARRTGADAVHPGYGFLSEDASFAAACEEQGLCFVGPPASVIDRMGWKTEARRAMQAAGIPIVPGEAPEDQSDEAVRAAVMRVGLPALVKASAGGGGKGMRVVREVAEMDEKISAARHEASAAFGDGALYVERLVEQPRHVEVQIFGDHTGRVVHLFERDCSVQRRHQKIIEESPSPAVAPKLRRRLCEAAVAAAQAVGYRSAGTVEFLLDGEGPDAHFYFLEMNTRLQVEHPVTEVVAGVDLVRAQLLVASGLPLPWNQGALVQRGHAIECRIYAEDPAQEFLPQAGTIELYDEPAMPGIRIDSGVAKGSEVPVFYDPLIAKLIACAETRDAAITRARLALESYAIVGVRTNIPFLLEILDHPVFRAGDVHTSFLDVASLPGLSGTPVPPAAFAAAASSFSRRRGEPAHSNRGAARFDPWESLKGWRA
jgi:3-methylcrotonyl-CoA carboxylase alpha subunit